MEILSTTTDLRDVNMYIQSLFYLKKIFFIF